MPASRSAAAVPPEATSSTPWVASPVANSRSPVLSQTLSNALIYSSSVPAIEEGSRPSRIDAITLPTTSGYNSRSTALMRSCSDSSVSSGSMGTRRWARIGPSSSASVAMWTVQPVSVTPEASAWATACQPLKAGSRLGCVLRTRPG